MTLKKSWDKEQVIIDYAKFLLTFKDPREAINKVVQKYTIELNLDCKEYFKNNYNLVIDIQDILDILHEYGSEDFGFDFSISVDGELKLILHEQPNYN